MATNVISKFVLSSAFLVKLVQGYYCEWDLCGAEQYCCGDNLCCDYVYSLWYFWIAVLFLVILVSACGGFFRYCYFTKSQVIHRMGGNAMKSGEFDEMSQPLVWDVESPPSYPSYKHQQLGGYPPPQEPPPPYSQSGPGHKQSDDYVYP